MSRLRNSKIMWRWPRGERGSILPYMALTAMLLTALALVIMVMLGDGVDKKRQAATAADAAALAAVGAWADALEENYLSAQKATTFEQFWLHWGQPSTLGASGRMQADARQFAAANDTTLTGLSTDALRTAVRARVRGTEAAERTSTRLTGQAAAEVVFQSSGPCVQGGRRGWLENGVCRLQPTPEEIAYYTSNPRPPWVPPPGVLVPPRLDVRLIAD